MALKYGNSTSPPDWSEVANNPWKVELAEVPVTVSWLSPVIFLEFPVMSPCRVVPYRLVVWRLVKEIAVDEAKGMVKPPEVPEVIEPAVAKLIPELVMYVEPVPTLRVPRMSKLFSIVEVPAPPM